MNQAKLQQLHDTLQSDLQTVYRKAIDIDQRLDELEKEGNGKFESVFSENSPFTMKAKRLLPYIEELAGDLELLLQETQLELPLQTYLAKLQHVHQVIARFKQI